jgi:2-dehydropantoate 2-reductase
MERFGEEAGSSMLHDRLARRPLEHQFLTGEVVRRGSAYGIDVLLNAAVLALLEAIDQPRTGAASERLAAAGPESP